MLLLALLTHAVAQALPKCTFETSFAAAGCLCKRGDAPPVCIAAFIGPQTASLFFKAEMLTDGNLEVRQHESFCRVALMMC